MKYGFVYLAWNRSMPGLYKIGCTTIAPLERLKQLGSNTSIPTKFNLLAFCQTEDPLLFEKECHSIWSRLRVENDREFFRMNIRHLDEVCEFFQQNGFTPWVDHEDLLFICSLNHFGDLA